MTPADLITPPILGSIAVIATTSSSAATNLAAVAPLAEMLNGEWITMIPDADMAIAFSNSDSGSVNEAATTGATAAMVLTADQVYRFAPPVGGYTWLHHKSPGGNSLLRIYVSSRRPTPLM